MLRLVAAAAIAVSSGLLAGIALAVGAVHSIILEPLRDGLQWLYDKIGRLVVAALAMVGGVGRRVLEFDHGPDTGRMLERNGVAGREEASSDEQQIGLWGEEPA